MKNILYLTQNIIKQYKYINTCGMLEIKWTRWEKQGMETAFTECISIIDNATTKPYLLYFTMSRSRDEKLKSSRGWKSVAKISHCIRAPQANAVNGMRSVRFHFCTSHSLSASRIQTLDVGALLVTTTCRHLCREMHYWPWRIWNDRRDSWWDYLETLMCVCGKVKL